MRSNDDAEAGSDRRSHERRVLERPKVDETYCAEFGHQRVARGDGDGRLADPSGTDDGNESSGQQPTRHGPDVLFTPYDSCGPDRQILSFEDITCCKRTDRAHYRRDEAITTAGYVPYAASVGLIVGKNLPQIGEMDAETSVIDGDVGPNSSDQFSVADNFAWAAQQDIKYAERSATYMYREAVCLKPPFDGKKAEGAKRDDRRVRRTILFHLFGPPALILAKAAPKMALPAFLCSARLDGI
jgi:hypothetical protein